MLKNLASIPIRILVTGSRGKSSLVRLLQVGLSCLGMEAWGRITGVLPREVGPGGERVIVRSSGGHVEEMRWWLKQVPAEAGAVILENSAVSPELQGLAAGWLGPTLVVWTNARIDHGEIWGPGVRGAETALLEGIPYSTPVAAGPEIACSPFVRQELEARGCRVMSDTREALSPEGFQAENLRLALCALSALGLDAEAASPAMEQLLPDIADFRLVESGGGILAQAFSANDPESTAKLWESLGWPAAETVLLYNHRPDRPARLKSFLPWLDSLPWKERFLMGPPVFRFFDPLPLRRIRLSCADDLDRFIALKKRVFGCGNVAGVPMSLLLAKRGAWNVA